MDQLQDLSTDRVKLINYDDKFKEPVVSAGLFNMHIKRKSIFLAKELGYDVVFYGDLYYPELDRSPNPNETRVIFKNNEKLNNFILFWDKISNRNNNYNTYHDGVYFGTSSVDSKMNMIGVTRDIKFTKHCKISHGEKFLNFFGEYL